MNVVAGPFDVRVDDFRKRGKELHDGLIGVQHKLFDPTRCGRSQFIGVLPGREKRVLQLSAIRESLCSIEFRVRGRRKNNGRILSLLELQTKDSGKEVVFASVEAAILLKRQKAVTVPVVPSFDQGFAA